MKWIRNVRVGKVEYVCEHGVGHTDPRSTKHTAHGCDGCCSRTDFPPNKEKAMPNTELEQELKWLRWFYSHADFGPADCDVRNLIKAEYEQSGGVIPEGYDE